MGNTINDLLRVNIEIEGLIRVLASATSDPYKYDAAKEMLLEKASQLAVLVENASISDEAEGMNEHHAPQYDKECTFKPTESSEEIQIETTIETYATDSYADPEGDSHTEDYGSDTRDVNPVEEHTKTIPTEKFYSTPKVELPNEVDEKLQIIDDNDIREEESSPSINTESEQEHTQPYHHEVHRSTFEDAENRGEHTQPYHHEEEDTPSILSDMLDPKDTRLEDVLAKKEKKALISAFTLNDKFRFIKGIFCDDVQDFDYTLDRLSECESLAEVYDYLLNDQGWDIDNDEIKDFISIIASYFNA